MFKKNETPSSLNLRSTVPYNLTEKNSLFDDKCSDFMQVRLFSEEKRMQMREMWAFSVKYIPVNLLGLRVN